MIDKIHLYSKDFNVKNGSMLELKQGNINLGTGEIKNNFPLFKIGGSYVEGAKAFIPDDKKTIPYQLDINSLGMLISFNPSKILYQNNFYTANNNGLKMVVEKLENELKEHIGFNINDCNVTRIDLCKNAAMNLNCFEYQELFRTMEATRCKAKEYPEGYIFGNKQKQIVFYDKIKELIEVQGWKPDTTNTMTELKNKNVLRCELRILKTKSVKEYLGIDKLSTLYPDDNYIELKNRFSQIVSKDVFKKKENSQLELFSFNNEVELLKHFRAIKKRNSIGKYLIYIGLENFFHRFGNMENFKKALEYAGYERTYIYKVSNDINKQLQSISFMKERFEKNKKSIEGMYQELYSKICI